MKHCVSGSSFALCLLCGMSRRCSSPGDRNGAKTIKLAFVTNNSADFWTIARRGVEKADAELSDVEAEFRITADGSAAEQQRIVDDLLTKGVDGIAISPVDPQNQTALIDAAAKRALVFTQDSDAPQTRAHLLHRHRQRGGRPPGRAAHSRSDSRGRLDHAVRRQARRAERAGADSGHSARRSPDPTIRIIDVRTDDVDDVRAKANAADTLVRYPDIKGLVGLWSYNGPAILQRRPRGRQGRPGADRGVRRGRRDARRREGRRHSCDGRAAAVRVRLPGDHADGAGGARRSIVHSRDRSRSSCPRSS